MRRRVTALLSLIAIVVSVTHAVEDSTETGAVADSAVATAAGNTVKFTPTIYGAIDVGQMVKGIALNPEGNSTSDMVFAHNLWTASALVGIGARATLNGRSSIEVALEGQLMYPAPTLWYSGNVYSDQPSWKFIVDRAVARHTFGDLQKRPFELGVGYFPFKYNPQVRNLGEYLFRSETYPGTVYTDFDFACRRLLGIQLTNNLRNRSIRHDLLVTMEETNFPYGDVSVSVLGDYTIARSALNLGAGVVFDRLFSVRGSYTSADTLLPIVTDTFYTYDTLSGDSVISGYDTTRYSPDFSGVKLMARVALDPKKFFNSRLLGPEDLKLYAELCILGVQNREPYFDDIARRMPISFGLNLPAFKVLDVLSVELEYYNSKYPNNYRNRYFQYTPEPVEQPVPQYAGDPVLDYERSPWKWTVYARRTLGMFTLTGEVGRDHAFLYYAHHTAMQSGQLKYGESMQASDHWFWRLRIGFKL